MPQNKDVSEIMATEIGVIIVMKMGYIMLLGLESEWVPPVKEKLLISVVAWHWREKQQQWKSATYGELYFLKTYFILHVSP